MDKYKQYLAINVLNESQIVNYRQLSRALKVHNHLAKQMLYDFHKNQNAKKPHSVHATYLLTGTPRTEPTESTKNTQTQDDEDSVMQSSPFPSSYPEPEPPLEFEDEDVEPAEENIPTTIVTLVREEDLEEVKEEFDDISTLCLYSLQPGTPQDVNVLTESNREALNQFSTEDPLVVYKQYGIIQNPNVKRRTGRKPPPLAAPATVVKSAVKPQAKVPAPLSANNRQNSATSQKSAASDTKSNPISLKREKSDIFKSFAKTKPPKAKGPNEATPVEDEPMKGMSEDEEGEEDFVMVEDTKESTAKAAAAKAERAERQKRLRDMMDDDDEPMADTPSVEGDEGDEEEKEEVDTGSPIDKPAAEEPKETVTVVDGRRRGRRRVMKKKTMKDEEGYLVTKEEAVWESFSEDEPQLKKAKTMAPSNAKGKKPAGKPGQGNIMSFFAKK